MQNLKLAYLGSQKPFQLFEVTKLHWSVYLNNPNPHLLNKTKTVTTLLTKEKKKKEKQLTKQLNKAVVRNSV